jgi:hypothetical protein
MHPHRTSPFGGPLAVVVIFLFALLALYPGASLRGQSAPAVATSADTVVTGADGEVADLVLKGKQLEVVYRNTGTVTTVILGELQVRDPQGDVVSAVAFVEGRRIEPGKTEKFRLAMPTLPAGRYVLHALVQFGGPALAAAQAELEVLPPGKER